MYAIRFLSILVLVQICLGENVFVDILGDVNFERLKILFSSLWIQSLSSTLLVSAAPVLIIFTIPDLKNHNNLLKVLLAFAAGGLLGDAFLHLIPHSIDPHDHTSGEVKIPHIDSQAHDSYHGHLHDHDHGHSHSHGHGHSHDGSHGHSRDGGHGHSHDGGHGHSHDGGHGHSHDGGHGHSHAHGHSSFENDNTDIHGVHDHTKNMIVGLWVVAGIMSFLCVEKFVRLMKSGHGHSHTLKSSPVVSDDNSVTDARGESKNPDSEIRNRKNKGKKVSKTNGKLKNADDSNIKVSGYLNLVADFAHNFTDGLAIGASFLVNKNVGIVTTITILFHELPHEIGDYAILIQSGCSRKKAILLQLLTAIGAILGTIISLISQDAGTSSTWILPFTAGGFIYISTVSVIPELLQEHTKLSQTIKEIMAMVVGVGMMVAIAYFE